MASMEDDYYDPYADEADENGAEKALADASELEKDYDLPANVPDAPPISAVEGVPLSDIYNTLVAMQNQVADSTRAEGLRTYLRDHPQYAVAMFQVLHECGLARIVDDETEEDELNAALGIESEEVMLEVPTAEAPPLPSGATTWLGKPRQRPGNNL